MGWRTHPAVIRVRSVARSVGITRFLANAFRREGYERQYDDQLEARIAEGDCVWDVGANIGYYSRRFAERVGRGGKVHAFEPSQSNFLRLSAGCSAFPQIVLHNVGLGSARGRLRVEQGADELGATTRIGTGSEGDLVEVWPGDELAQLAIASPPNIIKIDVEGFEVEVVEGMQTLLRSPGLRAIGVEVHFGLLAERGLPAGPQQLESLFRSAGFRISWTDSSHFVADRR